MTTTPRALLTRASRRSLVWLGLVAAGGTTTTRALLTRASRRSVIWLGLLTAAGTAIVVSQLQSGAAADAAPSLATATRGNLIVSVGGVGRIVDARATGQSASPGGGIAAATSSAQSGVAAPVSVDAVFPRTSGFVSRYAVVPGQRVVLGQALAILDDGRKTADAVVQAQNDLETALLEVRQLRTNDPLKGVRATRRELASARFAVISARQQLARLLRPRRADVSAARYDAKRAQADLETLLGGTPATIAEAIRIAKRNVELAQQRLNQALEPADAADVASAEAELARAESDLALLRKPPQGPSPEALTAAQQAVAVARLNLANAKAAVPADPALVAAAQLELDRALADLAALQRAPSAPLPEEIAAAQKTVDAARQKLAKLRRPPSAAAVTAARLDLERAQAELRRLQAGPGPAAISAARAAVSSSRARLAQVLGPPLRADLTAARLEIRRAQADLAVLRARGKPSSITRSFAQLKVKAARARLAAARYAQQLLTVRAPSAGTVTALLTVPGVPVDSTTPVIAVAGLDRLAVSVDLSEFDVARVKRGMRAVVSVDALGGKRYAGTVLFAALTGNDNGGLVTFPVRVSLTSSRGVKPGMNVSVRIIVAERRNVVRVPLEAVAHDDEDHAVVQVTSESGTVSVRAVKLGLANNESVEIVKGLRAGERVELAESESQGEEE